MTSLESDLGSALRILGSAELASPEATLTPLAREVFERLVDDGEFDELRARIRAGADDDQLDAAGLSRFPLRLKLQLVQRWRDRLAAALRGDPDRWRIHRNLRKLFQASDIVLGSLTRATGVGEPILEFKEVVETMAEDADPPPGPASPPDAPAEPPSEPGESVVEILHRPAPPDPSPGSLADALFRRRRSSEPEPEPETD